MIRAPGQLTPSIRLVRHIGTGGMGTVWAAWDADLEREVAVKLLLGGRPIEDGGKPAFQREVRAIGKLTSPHVVRMLRAEADPEPFLVMELLDGHTLHERLRDRGALSRHELTTIVRQLALALDEAHARGIVHRDVKPSNIFLCDGPSQPFIKLIDFGVAKVPASVDTTSSSSTTGGGTPNAMSPEQLLGSHGIGPATDIWAIGVLVFRCLAGHYPFAGETAGALALSVHYGPMPSLCAAAPGLPRAMDAWFARACARRAENRFTSATEAADALAEGLSGDESGTLLPVVAPAPAGNDATLVSPHAPPPTRRSARSTILVASICALVLGTTAWALGRSAPASTGGTNLRAVTAAASAGPLEPPTAPHLSTIDDGVASAALVVSAPSPPASPAPPAQEPTPAPSTSPPPAPPLLSHPPPSPLRRHDRARPQAKEAAHPTKGPAGAEDGQFPDARY